MVSLLQDVANSLSETEKEIIEESKNGGDLRQKKSLKVITEEIHTFIAACQELSETLQNLQKITHNFVGGITPDDKIMEDVCLQLGVNREGLKRSGRTIREVNEKRAVIEVLHNTHKWGASRIARQFGKDHATILHHLKVIKEGK